MHEKSSKGPMAGIQKGQGGKRESTYHAYKKCMGPSRGKGGKTIVRIRNQTS